MARYRIFYWKHIPSSFTVEGDGRTVKKQLSQKIQNAIDAYAMATGLTGTDEYSAQYKRGPWVTVKAPLKKLPKSFFLNLKQNSPK